MIFGYIRDYLPTTDSLDDDGSLVPFPTIARERFDATLAAIAGRPLTAEELATVERRVVRGRTLRVIADELFGESASATYFAPKGLID